MSAAGRAVAFSPHHITLLPYDVFLDIAECVPAVDVLTLSLTSQQMRGLLLPRLYHSLCLGSSAACASALPMLQQHPDICVHIRKLILRPNNRQAWPVSDSEIDEVWVASKVREISPHLSGLLAFEWDAEYFPDSELWMALRNSCPLLSSLRCVTVFQDFDPRSQLFGFDNLSEFSLCVRHQKEGEFSEKGRNFPSQLWKMLARCPNLELLNLSSADATVQFVPIRDLTSGCWPRLRSLTLTLIQYEVEHHVAALRAFLLAHPTITHLAIHPRTSNRASQNTLFARAAFPRLVSFVGGYYHLEQLPCQSAIQTLDITQAPLSTHAFARLVPALRTFVALTRLELRLSDYGTREDITAVAQACPALAYFRVTFVDHAVIRPRHFDFIAEGLRNLVHLRAFALEKRSLALDLPMLRTALLFCGHVPSLREIELRWFRDSKLGEQGTFAIVREAQGTFLEAFERGIGVEGDVFVRRYREPLPVGAACE
ncbi:hypothetical protein B0H15DRAFT_899847 [Mycena belliarum]|uniref:F-box domain-containing protein n=1 Tax=Mycena belliarum TaxID=1033014 RepID=A0AAD6UHZ1_9AGAR|nr:hypothetical protein B0H15DRAFT_899847 [Mycena belliae]